MADNLTSTPALTDDQYAAQIHDYVKNDLLAADNPSDDEVEHAYANVRTWLDSKGIMTNGVSYMQANSTDAYNVAVGPPYETLISSGTVTPVASTNVPSFDSKHKTRLILFVGLIILGIWFFFFKDREYSPAV